MTDPTTPTPAPAAVPGVTPGRVQIMVRRNASLRITGDFDLVDHEGRPIPLPVGKPSIALCRCGMSLKKPFCDSAHKTCGFVDPPEAPAPPAPVVEG
jgi:CDGSH-type Zn-finger protein